VPDPHAIRLAQLTAWVNQGDYLLALNSTNLWPDDPEFAALLTRAERGRAERYDGLLREAGEALGSEDFQRARSLAQEAIEWESPLASSPGQEAKAFLTKIENERRAWQTQQDQLRIDEQKRSELVAAWEAALTRGDYMTILNDLPRLTEAWRTISQIERLISRAEKMRQDAQELAAQLRAERNGKLEEWKRWLDQGDYQLLLEEADVVNARWPEDREFLALLDQAELLRSAALKRAAELAARKQDYAKATQAFLDGRYEQALANLGEHRTENEKDALEFDVLRGEIETEQTLLRRVQQPDTDPFELLARVDLPDKGPFQEVRKEARDRALAQLDRWLDEEDYEAILDGLKDQPYAGQEEFAQRMRLPRAWERMRLEREEGRRDEVQRMLEELGDDSARQRFQEFALWAIEPDPNGGKVVGGVDERIVRAEALLLMYRVLFAVEGAPAEVTINNQRISPETEFNLTYLYDAEAQLSTLEQQNLPENLRRQIQPIRDRIKILRRKFSSR
jgi:hypothetical protein